MFFLDKQKWLNIIIHSCIDVFRHFDGRIIILMKTSLQPSIDIDLKSRLKNLSSQSGIPIAKIIQKLLEQHLDNEERKQNI